MPDDLYRYVLPLSTVRSPSPGRLSSLDAVPGEEPVFGSSGSESDIRSIHRALASSPALRTGGETSDAERAQILADATGRDIETPSPEQTIHVDAVQRRIESEGGAYPLADLSAGHVERLGDTVCLRAGVANPEQAPWVQVAYSSHHFGTPDVALIDVALNIQNPYWDTVPEANAAVVRVQLEHSGVDEVTQKALKTGSCRIFLPVDLADGVSAHLFNLTLPFGTEISPLDVHVQTIDITFL